MAALVSVRLQNRVGTGVIIALAGTAAVACGLEAEVGGDPVLPSRSRSSSWEPERPLQPRIDLSQEPVRQLANLLFQRETVNGGELGDVDNRVFR